MDVKEAITKRKSVGKYQARDVPEALVHEMIDAARLAPSGGNAQPCKYLVVKDAKIKEKLKANEIFGQDFVYKAPVLIVCCTDPKSFQKKPGEADEQNRLRAIRDASIASAYLMLRATELGLATCYIGWFKSEPLKRMLRIPEEYLVPFLITVGYAGEQPMPTPRKSLEEVMLK